ncbi:MAG: ABC transporter permease [Chloroflexi bacterium]|nr:ABC transporter permease [Chloroflexota bacterium]MBV9893345.1 ABC transporter permease [Chloroflexota bacterium]
MAVSVPIQELAGVPAPETVATRSAWQVLLHNPKFVLGLGFFLVLLAVCLIGGFLAGPIPLRSGSFPPKLGVGSPGMAIAGTTTLGQSVLAQLFQAIPNSMLVGLVAAIIGTTLGALLGLLSGYFGGRVDGILRVLIDVFLSVPSLLFAVLVAALLKSVTVPVLAIVIGLFAWAWPSRAVRAQVLSLKERPFVQIALLSGLSGWEIVWGELLPYLLPWLGANFVNAFIAAILAESGLSILGLGPQQQMTLGQMIYWALTYGALLQNMWWWWAVPVLMLIGLFLALYMVHVGLDELSNPRLRGDG